jgi:hypothetical protein
LQHAEQLKNLSVQALNENGLNASEQSTFLIIPSQVSVSLAIRDNYFEAAITPALVKLALSQLKLPTDAVDVEAHLCEMILHGPGGHFKKHKESEKETGFFLMNISAKYKLNSICLFSVIGMFGTMVLQIPVQGGYEGGNLIVEHGDAKKMFPFDVGSSEKFFLVAFFTNCELQLEPVTQGWRLTMVFHLVWKNGMPPVRNPTDVPVFLEVLKEIKESFGPLLLPTNNFVQDLPKISAGISPL